MNTDGATVTLFLCYFLTKPWKCLLSFPRPLTTKILETTMSNYRNKCGVRRIVQGRVAGDLVWRELG